ICSSARCLVIAALSALPLIWCGHSLLAPGLGCSTCFTDHELPRFAMGFDFQIANPMSGTESAGDIDPLDVKKVYYKQAPNARFCAIQLRVLKWSLGRNMGVKMLNSLGLALHSSPGELCLVPEPSFTHS
uniref:Uncharacterized protein n=1 Tax=Serinus canaria TaxID=9135 RepID=A0A8C9NVN1_SERCA